MIPYLRTILTWLGALFKTSGSLIRTVVRQCLSVIRKLCLRTTRPPSQTLGSRLFASYPIRPCPASEKGDDSSSRAAEHIAASVSFPMPIPGNIPTQLLVPAVNLVEQPFTSPPPSVSSTECVLVLKPCAPKSWKRYKGRPLVSRTGIKPIPARKKTFEDIRVDGWQRFIHPEGAPYFYHATKRVFTDANLDKKQLKIINELIDQLMKEAGDTVNELTCLALEFPDRKSNECKYYFVQHDERLLFWVHNFEDPKLIYENVEGVKSDSHIKIALEAQYWMHCELYPNNVPIRREVATELKHVLLHANTDFLTSDTSVVPYDFPKLQSMLDLTNQVVEYVASEYNPPGVPPPHSGDTIELPVHLMCVLARLMRLFARSKFLNFFGQVSARLSANQSVYVPEDTRTNVTGTLTLANFFLCGAPARQYRFLRETWVDDILNYPRWSKYISKLNNDWSGVTIFSTVMLAVDISFLAVPGIVTRAAVCISLSTMCSVSSLVVSMVLGGESRGWGTDSAEGAASFMARKVGKQRDIEALAIMYSLPYAFLIWGMICFVAALGITVFHYQNPVILVIIAIGWVTVTCLTLWPVWWGKLSIAPHYAPSNQGRQARQVV